MIACPRFSGSLLDGRLNQLVDDLERPESEQESELESERDQPESEQDSEPGSNQAPD
jgi:hypothetical protein